MVCLVCGIRGRSPARALLAIALAVVLAAPARADEPSLVGAWELTSVPPADIVDTDPRGILNLKLSFTSDGRLSAIRPDASSLEGAQAATYTFDGKRLVIQSVAMQVSFPDPDTMVLTQQSRGARSYRRLSSIEQRIEPRSLELVAVPGRTDPVTYDSKDYSRLPVPARVRGVWEVVALEDVPREQAPPYGFFNDMWVIGPDKVTISRRNPPATDSVPFALSKGTLASSAIGLGAGPGARIDWKVAFDEWGRLVLASDYCRVVLKLVTKDTSAQVVAPVKIVLLTLKE